MRDLKPSKCATIKFGHVSCIDDDSQALCNTYGVSTYPAEHAFWRERGQPQSETFSGVRGVADVLQWVKTVSAAAGALSFFRAARAGMLQGTVIDSYDDFPSVGRCANFCLFKGDKCKGFSFSPIASKCVLHSEAYSAPNLDTSTPFEYYERDPSRVYRHAPLLPA